VALEIFISFFFVNTVMWKVLKTALLVFLVTVYHNNCRDDGSSINCESSRRTDKATEFSQLKRMDLN